MIKSIATQVLDVRPLKIRAEFNTARNFKGQSVFKADSNVTATRKVAHFALPILKAIALLAAITAIAAAITFAVASNPVSGIAATVATIAGIVAGGALLIATIPAYIRRSDKFDVKYDYTSASHTKE